MHVHNTAAHTHEHIYGSGAEQAGERRTRLAVLLTSCMMAAEIACGTWFNSMALIADGWHMATHVVALGIAAFAYAFARRQARNPRFTFGTGKVGALGGFTSAVLLAGVALMIAGESVLRLLAPRPIVVGEAIGVALLGLLVNLACAWLLREQPHDHAREDEAHHHDHNLRAAYLHVLADAVTSLLAIGALVLVHYGGWLWMDALTGLIGSFVIASWAFGLVRASGRVLLDETPDPALADAVRSLIERDQDNQVTDLHLWHIAPNRLSAIVSLVTDTPRPPAHYKALLREVPHLVHVTVEVNKCE